MPPGVRGTFTSRCATRSHRRCRPTKSTRDSGSLCTGRRAPGKTTSALGERLLDHELRRLAVIAFDKALVRQQRTGVLHQCRAAADHDAVMFGRERRKTNIAEQLA